MIDLVQALSAPGQPASGFAALELAMRRAIGHRLFTIMRHDAGRGVNSRVHSSSPLAYPTGGEKRVADTAWTRQLLREGRPFIGRCRDDIRAHFADHAQIEALGCESVLNLPVIWNGRVIGTVNLLDRAAAYVPHHARMGMAFTPFAIPGLLD